MFYPCLFDSIQIKKSVFFFKFIIIRGLCFYKKRNKNGYTTEKKLVFPFVFIIFVFLVMYMESN